MREMLGFEPAFTTAEAFADFAAGLTPTGGRVERVLGALADQLPPVDEPALALGERRG
jgi:UDP-glucose 4-epimerase